MRFRKSKAVLKSVWIRKRREEQEEAEKTVTDGEKI